MRIRTICFAAFLLGASAPAAWAGDDADKRGRSDCERAPVVDFWEGAFTGQAVSGRATLCGDRRGLSADMKIRGLTPGGAYTVWWVYVDDPASCANFPLTPDNSSVPVPEPLGYATPCGLADFFTVDPTGTFLDPLVVFGRMDGIIARDRRFNRFSGEWRDMIHSPGSQVWMLVFGHGPADLTDGRQLARQLLTPEDPLSGTPHLGIEGRMNGYPAAVAVFTMP